MAFTVRISAEEWPYVRGIFQLHELAGRRRLPTEIYADARCLAQSRSTTLIEALDAIELRLLLEDTTPPASYHPDTSDAA